MTIKHLLSFLLIFVLSLNQIKAQENKEESASLKGKLGFSAVMGHAFIKHNVEDVEENEITSVCCSWTQCKLLGF
ncbi:hypothetical protein [Flavobacterium sp. CS20]|uniref:hypothetical protein n=1 Tax=Flavobacterium sp. CS20 TaxID=2775246 RepID=UPI001B3A3C06|nr:hypothetical protein [Flavobacterium sp. CS20]QTY27204.1 hypothetical protein IGB25_00970 [Flavobacterium sp. CS20]